MEFRVSVRGLVEFLLRSGSIDNRRSAPDQAMAEGGRVHRMLQKRMGAGYQAEVPMHYLWHTPSFDLRIEGRADGVLEGDTVLIDEIKGTYRDLEHIREPEPAHLAQAKCYAYMYACRYEQANMQVRMTYCQLETEALRLFTYKYTTAELESWFYALLEDYRKWVDYVARWNQTRDASCRALTFPYAYREGQKRLAAQVYTSIVRKKKLFIQAPTGVGKTLSVVFPAVKAIGEGKAGRIFYLTAKNITGSVADQTFSLLREHGLSFKTVVLTAKEKICLCKEPECNPSACPYADGHYNRINAAIYELLTLEDHYSRERIVETARQHRVCPFELGLDMSLFSDAVICDYNYAFDPHAYLRRFFGEQTQAAGALTQGMAGDPLFLVDEAHNLVDRGREMYSAELIKEELLELKERVKGYDKKIATRLAACNRQFLTLKRDCPGMRVEASIEPLVQELEKLSAAMNTYLEEVEESPVRKDILSGYFEVSHFLDIYELLDEHYVIYSELDEAERFRVKLFCVDPSRNLAGCMQRARSTILFSATFLPIQYYKGLLGGETEDYEVYAPSPFDPARRGLFIARDVTSRYLRRSGREYYRIAAYLSELTKGHVGNYLFFFPSYAFLSSVYEQYEKHFYRPEAEECLLQEESMTQEEREAFLARFERVPMRLLEEAIRTKIELEEGKSLLGFCVLGGIFGEGIDLKEDSLVGAVIVGTGLPQICNEREILRSYFDQIGKNGFDYAYRYPGMNKVEQAAGRVIRTKEDVGFVALLDDRFLESAYQRLFPREWTSYVPIDLSSAASCVERFWEEWK